MHTFLFSFTSFSRPGVPRLLDICKLYCLMFRNLQCEIKQTKSNKEGPLMLNVTRLFTDSCTIQNVSKNDIERGYVECNVYL